MLPPALAAHNENVLTSVKHTYSDKYMLTGSGRLITLTVPYDYAGGDTLDLSNGLDIFWDGNRYKQVVAEPAPASITINNSDTAKLTVKYNLESDPEGTLQGTTVYSVRVKKAAKVSPTFSGSISKEIPYTEGVQTTVFTYGDFESKYKKNNGEDIGYIAIAGSNPSFGTLQAKNADGIFENYNLITRPLISINPLLDDTVLFTFEATSCGTVSYNVSAFEGSNKTQPIGNVVVTITIYDTPVMNTNSNISEELSKGQVKTFSEAYFTSRCNLNGLPLYSVEIIPDNTGTGSGVWSDGATPFTTARTIPASQLRNLTFKASAAGTVNFSWSITTKGSTTSPLPSAQEDGTYTVISPKLTLFPYGSGASVLRGKTWSMSPGHFVHTPSGALSYVKITSIPAAGDGYLYLSTALPKNDTYGYPAIAANTALKANDVIPASYLNYLKLATKTTGTNTAVSFRWTATADAGVTAAVWAEDTTYTVGFISGGSLPLSASCYETDMNMPLPLASDDITGNFRRLTGDSLSYLTFKLPDKNCGTLYLNYDILKKTGTAVGATTKYYASKEPNLSKITFVPAKDYTGTFAVSYNAYTEDGAFLSGQINFKVNSNAGGTFSYMTDKNSPLQFDAKDFQAAFLTATGKPLSYVRFSPLPTAREGYLCYNYSLAGDFDSVVSSGQNYYVYKAQYLSLVTFMPYRNMTGDVVIYYTGYTENGTGYNGKLYISIVDSPAGIVQYPVREKGSVTLKADDFSTEFISVTGSVMSHVTFTPPAAASGSLLFKYDAGTETGTAVTSAIKYYNGKGPDISDIAFIPAKDFTGICLVTYTAYSTSGASYAGKLKFNVFDGTSVVSFNAEAGRPVKMSVSDFTSAFYMNSGGKNLSYAIFDLPSVSYGRFYYNYTSSARFDYAVSAGSKFYLTGTPYLSNVSFVPSQGYNGSFSVTYTGYTSGGNSYTGKIKITVSGSAGGTVSYETDSMTPVAFKTADFITAFAGKTGNPLHYVRFTQPNASFGTLYEQYNPQLSYNTQVYPSNNYYANYSKYISDVSFMPNPGFSGTLAVSYTAYDAYGNAFTGTILVSVRSSAPGTITYGTNTNTPVLFDPEDFSTAFLNKTGSPLHYVTFTLPPSSAGTLYLGYNSPTSYTSAVSASAKYYRSYAPFLSDISFVPKTGYSGSVVISYTGYSAGGTGYNGRVIINVGVDVPYMDMGKHAWAQEAVDYLYRRGVLPDGGGIHFYPGADMTRGEFMMMIANAFYLTGNDSGNFPDVPAGSPYYDAISAAKAFDIARGDDTGQFRPEWGLTRQDAMVLIVRAFKNTGRPLTPGSTNDLKGFSDASQVSGYAAADLGALVRIGFIIGTDGNLNPRTTFTRAEAAMLLFRIMSM